MVGSIRARRAALCVLIAGSLAALVVACSSDGGSTPTDGDGDGGSSGDGGSAPSACEDGFYDDSGPCHACALEHCGAEGDACWQDLDCRARAGCAAGCALYHGGDDCLAECSSIHGPSDLYDAFTECMATSCGDCGTNVATPPVDIGLSLCACGDEKDAFVHLTTQMDAGCHCDASTCDDGLDLSLTATIDNPDPAHLHWALIDVSAGGTSPFFKIFGADGTTVTHEFTGTIEPGHEFAFAAWVTDDAGECQSGKRVAMGVLTKSGAQSVDATGFGACDFYVPY